MVGRRLQNGWKTVGRRLQNRWKTIAKPLEDGCKTVATSGNPKAWWWLCNTKMCLQMKGPAGSRGRQARPRMAASAWLDMGG